MNKILDGNGNVLLDMEDKWEIINEGTLDEAASLLITKDSNGNDFELKKGILKIITGDATTIASSYAGVSNKNNTSSFNNANSVRLYVGGNNSSYRRSINMMFDTEQPSKLEITNWQNAQSRGSSIYLYSSDGIITGTNPSFQDDEFAVDVCRCVFFNLTIPTGSKWRLLGVRA